MHAWLAWVNVNATRCESGRVEVVHGDGGVGYHDEAPYDRIIITVGAPDIAPA